MYIYIFTMYLYIFVYTLKYIFICTYVYIYMCIYNTAHKMLSLTNSPSLLFSSVTLTHAHTNTLTITHTHVHTHSHTHPLSLLTHSLTAPLALSPTQPCILALACESLSLACTRSRCLAYSQSFSRFPSHFLTFSLSFSFSLSRSLSLSLSRSLSLALSVALSHALYLYLLLHPQAGLRSCRGAGSKCRSDSRREDLGFCRGRRFRAGFLYNPPPIEYAYRRVRLDSRRQDLGFEGCQRPTVCLIFTGHFPQKSRIDCGSVA